MTYLSKHSDGTSNVLVFIGILVFVSITHGQFLYSPLFFDDHNLFMQINGTGEQVIDSQFFSFLEIRSLPYASFAWTKAFFGTSLLYFRLGNLLLHIATVCTLYVVLKTLLLNLYTPKYKHQLTAQQAALLGTFLFAAHPLATFAISYLVQRTIIMATLFSLISIWFYIQGCIKNNNYWLWCCVPFYYLAVFSKEHAIMLPAALVAITILLHPDWTTQLRKRWSIGLALTSIFCCIVLIKMQTIGSTYELEAPTMLGKDLGPLAYPLSIITQCGLFFKYVFLWLLPKTTWTSIDMREPFVRSLTSWNLLSIGAYFAWGFTSLALLFKRNTLGLIGFAMFFPWIMFFTELASVRIQEPFVLYRSYLWFSMGLLALPLLFVKVEKNLIFTVSGFICILFFILTMERLVTFSHPILVWEDAKKLLTNKSDQSGHDRIYYNLGRNQLLEDLLDPAEENIRRALAIDPEFAQAYGVLGAIQTKKQEWNSAIASYSFAKHLNEKRKEPPQSVYLVGRAKAYEGAGELQKAANDYLEGCRINFYVCEMLRKSAVAVP